MLFETRPQVDDLEARELISAIGAGEVPGWFLDSVERELCAALTAMTLRSEQRAWLNQQLREFGFYVTTYPNWRHLHWGALQ